MRSARVASMRPFIALAVVALATPAYAGSHHTGGEGGRLSQVSAGVRGAVASTPAPGGSAIGDLSTESNYVECGSCQSAVVVGASGGVAVAPQQQPGATVEGSAAAQKVFESTGSVSLALSVVDRRLRFNLGVTQYYEDRMDGGRLTMMMPSLSGGVRLDPGSPTQLWLEGGATAARIQGDPAGDSMLVAPMLGARVVHPLSPRLALLGDAECMFFSHDVRAFGGRVAVRFEHVELAFRALDFNVGPALFGPELGVGF
jgi:hypothetical protein